MQNRKDRQKKSLNSLRLALLDWDPLNCFSMGMGGLSEYDPYLPTIAKALQNSKSPDEFRQFLSDFAFKEFDGYKNHEEINKVSDILLKIRLNEEKK